MIEVAHPDLTEAVYTQRVIWKRRHGGKSAVSVAEENLKNIRAKRSTIGCDI
jgi:hypothetical protein